MRRPASSLRNDPKRYQSRGALGGARGPAGTSSFSSEEQRERAERAVIDDRGYIHFAPAIRRPKD